MVTTLFRPVGKMELEKIELSKWKCFPPRLFWQPIFYPVLNLEYAIIIARDWNTKDPNSGYCGIVTAFDVNTDYLSNYKIQQAGSIIHKEYWIPSEHLSEFNSNIIGPIRLVDAYYGGLYQGEPFYFNQ